MDSAWNNVLLFDIYFDLWLCTHRKRLQIPCSSVRKGEGVMQLKVFTNIYIHLSSLSFSLPLSRPLSLSIWVIGNMQEAIVGYLLVAPLCTSSQLFSWFVLFIFVRVFGVLFLFFFHIRMRIFTLFLIYVRPGIPGRHTRLPGKGVESSRVLYPVL